MANAHLRNAIQFKTLAPSLPNSKHSDPMFSETRKRQTREAEALCRRLSWVHPIRNQIPRLNSAVRDHEPSRFSSISRHYHQLSLAFPKTERLFSQVVARIVAHFPTNHACRSIEDIWNDARMGARGTSLVKLLFKGRSPILSAVKVAPESWSRTKATRSESSPRISCCVKPILTVTSRSPQRIARSTSA